MLTKPFIRTQNSDSNTLHERICVGEPVSPRSLLEVIPHGTPINHNTVLIVPAGNSDPRSWWTVETKHSTCLAFFSRLFWDDIVVPLRPAAPARPAVPAPQANQPNPSAPGVATPGADIAG